MKKENITLPEGTLKKIHINQHMIRKNMKSERETPNAPLEPVVTVKCGKDNYYGFSVEVKGESKVTYSPEKPMSCGAKVWIETTAEVTVIAQKS